MNKKIFVAIEFKGEMHSVGYLWSALARNGRESATFEYASTWLESPDCFALEPALMLAEGPYHTPQDKPIFGALGDSAPDRWGRVLMRREERLKAEKEKRSPRTLMEIDYLLMVNDEAREGALRFSLQENGPFLADLNQTKIPPLIHLPKLLNAAFSFTNDSETEEELRLLLAPGSSLGGARPKASIRDRDGHLAIAKFPSKTDEYSVVLWEALALKLASKANITVPPWRIEKINDKNVLILRRFDRNKMDRIPYLSAMSMLNARDNTLHSYLEIADAIRQQGAQVKLDLKELWRRIVFSIMISNTDDHLRNHGFLYQGQKGWNLSPAFDLNPVPLDIRPKILSTAIDVDDPTASLDLALHVSAYFDLSMQEANNIISEVAEAVSTWKKEAKLFGIVSSEIERMSSAFQTD